MTAFDERLAAIEARVATDKTFAWIEVAWLVNQLKAARAELLEYENHKRTCPQPHVPEGLQLDRQGRVIIAPGLTDEQIDYYKRVFAGVICWDE